MEEGYRIEECEVCGEKFKTVIPKHPHAWKLIPEDDPYYNDGGIYRCAECGAETKYDEHIARFWNCDHEYTTTIVPPTATNRGYTLYKCSKCGFEFRTDFVEPLGKKANVDVQSQNP